MIIGNGLIGTAFLPHDRDDVVFFASGVSNSLETDSRQFQREEDLILKVLEENPNKLILYFSTCSIYDSSKNGSAYVNHKLNMEHLIASNSSEYLILRVSNAVGKGGNKNTLINYLVESIQSEKPIQVHIEATRNLIDIEDIVKISLELVEKNQINRILNLAYLENYSILQILTIIEKFLGKKADLELVKAGQSYSIDIPEVETYFRLNNKENKEKYLANILSKYF